jgi:hypothetical protein
LAGSASLLAARGIANRQAPKTSQPSQRGHFRFSIFDFRFNSSAGLAIENRKSKIENVTLAASAFQPQHHIAISGAMQ